MLGDGFVFYTVELFAVYDRMHGLNDILVGSHPQKRIHFGHEFFQIVAEAFGQTTCDNQPFQSAHFLLLLGFQDGINRLFLGVVDKTTGIDDRNVRFFNILNKFKFIRKRTQHRLGIHSVF